MGFSSDRSRVLITCSGPAEKRGEQRPRGGGRRARAGDDLLFGGGEMPGDGWCGAEMVEEAVADLGPECGAGLLGAAPRPDAGPFECRAEACDIVPDFADAGPFAARERAHPDLPFGQRGPDQPQRVRIIGSRALRCRGELAVGLVDEDEIGELDDAAPDPLQLLAGRPRPDPYENI